MVLAPPFLICWTVAALIVRSVHDRPVGMRVAFDVLTTGIQVGLIWSVVSTFVAILAGIATVVPLLFWPGGLEQVGIAAAIPVSGAALTAVALVGWKLLWPITRDEWRRITHSGETRSPADFVG